MDKVIELYSDLSSYIDYNVSGVRNAGDINGDQKNEFLVYTNNDIFLFYGADEINSIPDLSIRHETLPINDPRILTGADLNNDGIYELLTPVSSSSEFGSEVNRYDLNSEKYLYLKDSLDHVGIGDKLVSNWKVYPNPVKDILYLKGFVSQGTVTECIIYDINGKEIIRKELLCEPISINLQDLSPSVYLVRIISGDEVFIMRSMKE